MNDLICKPWLDLQEEILENRKTYKQFEKEISEGLMDDVKKEIENGEMYEIVANTIMISKWTGIRKSQSSHVKVIQKRGKYYLCLLYTSPSPRDGLLSRMPSSA